MFGRGPQAAWLPQHDGDHGQSNQQLAEISMSDGLPTSSTRKLIELATGSVAVATDAGLLFLPNNQPNLKRISKQIGIQQCWDLHEEEGLIYVATYNDGLYVFEIATGNLVNHYAQLLRVSSGELPIIFKDGIKLCWGCAKEHLN